MPRQPTAQLNYCLHSRKAQMSRTHFLPSLKAIEEEIDHNEIDDLLDAMQETLVCGSRHANHGHAQSPFPDLKEQFPTVFHPRPGRQLWGWSTIHKLTGNDDLRVMQAVALRPSEEQVTPLHAFTSIGDNQSDLRRLTIRLGSNVDHNQIRHYLRWQDFGHHHNDAYFSNDRHHLSYDPPRNGRRTPAQHYALQLDPAGNMPIQSVLMEYPPVYQELKDKLQQAYVQAKMTLQEGPNRPYVKATHQLLESHAIPPKVARIVLGHHPYNGPTPWNRLFDPSIAPEEHAELMVARQVTQQLYHSSAMSPYITLAISLLSGASPASFALAAIDRLERTGVSFMTEGSILKVIDLISLFDPPRGTLQIEQREELIAQLEQLAVNLAVAQDSISPHLAEEAYTMLNDRDSLPAWGRL